MPTMPPSVSPSGTLYLSSSTFIAFSHRFMHKLRIVFCIVFAKLVCTFGNLFFVLFLVTPRVSVRNKQNGCTLSRGKEINMGSGNDHIHTVYACAFVLFAQRTTRTKRGRKPTLLTASAGKS